MTNKIDCDAIVVGAGFAGLALIHHLKKTGISVKVLDKASEIGGTWAWNRYPGAATDSEGYYYCLTFSKEILQEWTWSERYPGWEETNRYLNFVADKCDMWPHIQLDTEVISAEFNKEDGLWIVKTKNDEELVCKYFISAMGMISQPVIPSYSGIEDFEGPCFHSSRWPQEGVNYNGKKVGIVGCGASTVQMLPIMAETAESVTVFQRTPNFSVPAHNGPLSEEFKGYVKNHSTEIRDLMHKSTNGHPFLIEERSALDTPPKEREALFEKAWDVGGLRFRTVFQDLLFDKKANATAVDFIRKKIRGIVKDQETADRLTNFDHPFAAKRPPIDTNYFETFNRENVELVDVRADPIQSITKNGLKTGTNNFPLDIIVFATGFDAMTGTILGIDIAGSNGVLLKDVWNAGPRTYLGLQIKGFPNLFTITGPGSPSVLCNMPVAIEQHVEWITDCIEYMRQNGHSKIETTTEATDTWVDHVNEAANNTLLPYAKHSWYLGANIPGKPRVFMPYVGGMANYRIRCASVAKNNYEGFVLSKK